MAYGVRIHGAHPDGYINTPVEVPGLAALSKIQRGAGVDAHRESIIVSADQIIAD